MLIVIWREKIRKHMSSKFFVRCCHSAGQTLELLFAQAYCSSLILLEIDLPRMDGIELVKRLNNMPYLKGTIIIFWIFCIKEGMKLLNGQNTF